jgi:hypothetical protein
VELSLRYFAERQAISTNNKVYVVSMLFSTTEHTEHTELTERREGVSSLCELCVLCGRKKTDIT